MAVTTAREILHIPGRVFKDPSDLTDTVSFGTGTQLGIASDVVFSIVQRRTVIQDEVRDRPHEVLTGDSDITVAMNLRTFDADALAQVFSNTSVSTATGKLVITHPGSFHAGRFESDSTGFALLFAADATEDSPSFILYQAVGHFALTADLQFQIKNELIFPTIFTALPDGMSPARVYQMGLLEDLVL